VDIFQAVILGIVQALTEFLPVSSSGHLVLFQKLFHISEPPIFFDTLVHAGSLLAIIFYLRGELVKVTKNMIFLVIVGTVPIAVFGLLLKDSIDNVFSSLSLVGFSFIGTGLILSSTLFVKKFERRLEKIDWTDSVFVGFFQALALLPGISRSGSTIVAGLWRGMTQESSFRLSFFLAIPAILGALVLQLLDISEIGSGDMLTGLIGLAVSFVFGILALRLLEKALLQGRLYLFAVYCFILGIVVLVFLV